MVVVLPVPLTPQTRITWGRRPGSSSSGRATGSRMRAIDWASAPRTSSLADLLAESGPGQLLDQLARGLDPEVGGDQRLLELLEALGIEPALGKIAPMLSFRRSDERLSPGAAAGTSPRAPRPGSTDLGRRLRPPEAGEASRRCSGSVMARAARAAQPSSTRSAITLTTRPGAAPSRETERRERLGVAAPPPLDQHPAPRGRPDREAGAESALAGGAQPGGALLAHRLRHLRHPRGRRALARRVREHVQMHQLRLLDQCERVARTSPRSRSGSPRSDRRRTRSRAAAAAAWRTGAPRRRGCGGASCASGSDRRRPGR